MKYLSFFILFSFLPIFSVQAYVIQRTKLGALQHWVRLPIEYAIDKDGLGNYFTLHPKQGAPGSEFNAIHGAFNAWQHITCSGKPSKLAFQSRGKVAGIPIGYDPTKGAQNVNLVKFFITKDSWRHGAERLAMTTTTFNQTTGEILDADIEINAAYFELSTQTTDESQMRWDIQNTVTHEVGHVIGLGHSKNSAATMYPEGGQKELSKRKIHADDIAAVCSLYPVQNITIPLYQQVDMDSGLGCSTSASSLPFSASPLLLVFLLFFLFFSSRRNS